MKRHRFIILSIAIVLFSCQERKSIVDLSTISTDNINIQNTVNIDSMFAVNIFLYGDYVVAMAPQSNFSKAPYRLYDRHNLQFIGQAGGFGNSGNEFINVNPYFISYTSDGFYQSINGTHIAKCSLSNGKLNIMERTLLCGRPTGLLCKTGNESYIIDGIDGDKELEKYDAKNNNYSDLCSYPTDIFPIKDKEEYLNFYGKHIAYASGSDNLFCFYVNIPLVKTISVSDGKEHFYIIGKNIVPAEVSKQYLDESEIYYYTLAKAKKNGVYALYCGNDTNNSSSEIHMWDASGTIVKRWYFNHRLRCFDIDEDRGIMYGIYTEDSKDLLFSAKTELQN